jgi:hypothetical protein
MCPISVQQLSAHRSRCLQCPMISSAKNSRVIDAHVCALAAGPNQLPVIPVLAVSVVSYPSSPMRVSPLLCNHGAVWCNG